MTGSGQLTAGYLDKCRILAENMDGSIFAHIPAAYAGIALSRQLTKQQSKVEILWQNRQKSK